MGDFPIRKEKVAARVHQPPMTQSAAGQKRLVTEFCPKMTGPIVATERGARPPAAECPIQSSG